MIVWLNLGREYHPYVLSAYEADEISKNPLMLASFTTVLHSEPQSSKQWEDALLSYKEFKLARETIKKNIFDHALAPKMFPLVGFFSKNTILYNEYRAIVNDTIDYVNARPEPLEHAAKLYFSQLYSQEHTQIISFDFYAKSSGVQLGRKLKITYSTASHQLQTINYFIKTYQGGSLAEGKKISKVSIEPKELFLYKVFEYLGVGQKVHFFINSDVKKSLFIATQDAAFTKSPKTKVKKFLEYAKIEPSLAASPDSVNENTKKALARIDLLSRIFNIRDIATNGDNFGRVTIQSEKDSADKWRIIDFRAPDDSYSSYRVYDIFAGFLNGNGMYNYTNYLLALLKYSPEKERVIRASTILTELNMGLLHQFDLRRHMNFSESLSAAKTFVMQFVREHSANLLINYGEFCSDIDRYVTEVNLNFQDLMTAVKEYNQGAMYTDV